MRAYFLGLLRSLPAADVENGDHPSSEGEGSHDESWVTGFAGDLLQLDPEIAEQSIDGDLPEGDYDGSEEYRADCRDRSHISHSNGTRKLLRNPLEWWRLNQLRFPRLAVLACRFLAMPATSVPSEHLFGDSGNIVTAKRSRLGNHVVS